MTAVPLTLHEPSLLKTNLLIDGAWVSGSAGYDIAVHNPFTGALVASVAAASQDECVQAVQAAATAFSKWRLESPQVRQSLLQAWRALILAHRDDLARLLSYEQGKPAREALTEITYVADYIDFYAAEAVRLLGEVIPSPVAGSTGFVTRQPVGPVAIIAPWNFPAAMFMRKVAPALAAGCTCVVKPDERTPLTALAFAELACRAGMPRGVVNFVVGNPGAIAPTIIKHPAIRKVSFTGSVRVGREIYAACVDDFKRVTLELGGNAPFIVFDSAVLPAAVTGAVASKFRNAGQTCICLNRLLVQANVHDAMVEALIVAALGMKGGHGIDNPDYGPLISRQAMQRVGSMVDAALQAGATLAFGGDRNESNGLFQPTILTNVTPDMAIAAEEIFGPVIPVIKFNDESEAITLANATPYGLAAYLYSEDRRQVTRVTRALDFGMIAVNTGVFSSALIPFGGVKHSGFGREGSAHGINDFLDLKYIAVAD